MDQVLAWRQYEAKKFVEISPWRFSRAGTRFATTLETLDDPLMCLNYILCVISYYIYLWLHVSGSIQRRSPALVQISPHFSRRIRLESEI